jgi:hypothetical protein
MVEQFWAIFSVLIVCRPMSSFGVREEGVERRGICKGIIYFSSQHE